MTVDICCDVNLFVIALRGTPVHLGESAAVEGHDFGVGTFQFLDDLKALVELGEDVHHRTGKEGVLGRLLELETE